jgi:Bacteriophage Mu Gam like protein
MSDVVSVPQNACAVMDEASPADYCWFAIEHNGVHSWERPDAAVESVATLSAEDVGWMMRQIQQAKSRMAEEDATGAALIARLHEEIVMVALHVTAASKADADRIDYLEAQLTAHLLNKRAADPECKSIATPWGRIESEAQQPQFVRDEAALLAWAEEQELLGTDGWVRTKTSREANWNVIKAVCEVRDGRLLHQGEIVPGVTVTERPLKVTIRVAD